MGMSRQTFFNLKNVKNSNSSDKKELWYDEELNEIIFYLIKERKAQKMTQEDIAQLCECPRSTIARAEALISQPSAITLIRWCKALGYKLELKN